MKGERIERRVREVRLGREGSRSKREGGRQGSDRERSRER
jgi:hypothetical protein